MATVSRRVRLDEDAFRTALEGLPDKGLIRLRNKAHYFAFGTGMDGSDLFNEAIVRTLGEDGRNCPADVPVEVFLTNAMRSIASGERKKYARELPSGGGHEEEGFIGTFPDPSPSLADKAIARVDLTRVVERLQRLFDDDQQALAVLIGDMEGWSAEEIREMEKMDANEYAAARKRVRRTIDREIGGRNPHGE